MVLVIGSNIVPVILETATHITYVFNVLVKGRSGYRLVIDAYRLLTGEQIDHKEVDITSDEFRYKYTMWPPNANTEDEYAVVFKVVDSNGNTVEMATKTAALIAKAEAIDLGDYFDEIIYISKLGNVYYYNEALRFLLQQQPAQVQPEQIRYLRRVVPRPVERFVLLAWKQGKMVIVDEEGVKEYTGGTAILRVTIRVPEEVAEAFTDYIDDPDVLAVVYKAPDIGPFIGAVAYVKHVIVHRGWRLAGVHVERVDGYYNVHANVVVTLRTPFDLWQAIKTVGGIVMSVVGSLMAYNALGAIATGAVAGPVGIAAAAIAAAIGVGLTIAGIWIATSKPGDNPEQYYEKAKQIVQESSRRIQEYIGSLEQYLNKLVQQGRITEEEKEKIIAYVNRIKEEHDKSMNEILNIVKNLKEEVERQRWQYLLVGGAVGVAVGLLLSRG